MSLDKIHESPFVKSIHLSKPNEYETENKSTLFIHTLAVMFICIRKTNQTPRVSRAAFQLDHPSSVRKRRRSIPSAATRETSRTTAWTRRKKRQ